MGKKIAVIGLGIIGSRAADCLASAGHKVTTWNRTPKKRSDFCNHLLAAVQDHDIVSLYLKDGQAIREVFATIRDALRETTLLLNHSTVDLETTLWLEAQCQQIGCSFLDAPFTGSKIAAQEGALVYYVGGDQTVLDSVRPILEATSKEIKYLGPIGNATIVKIATNLISASTVQALSEALAIATHHGIDATTFTEAVLSNACGSALAKMKLSTMAAGDYEPHFSLENMLKDSRFAIELAEKAGIDTPGIHTTSQAMQNRCKEGDEKLDFSALFKAYE